MSKISIPDESWREDEEYDLMVQRDVDDRWEEEVKTLLDAFVDGRQAGRELLSAEMNPHPLGSEKWKAWERGRITALGQRAA